MSDENPIKRWTAKRKAAIVMTIFNGKTSVAKVARVHDLTVSEIRGWIDDAQRSMKNGLGLARRTFASSTNLNCGRQRSRWARPTCRFMR